MNKKGFTLIELLVVVLIIGILSAVALPQYQKTVLKSRAAEAWANLSTLNKGIQAYCLENPSGNASLGYGLEDSLPVKVENSNNFTYHAWVTCTRTDGMQAIAEYNKGGKSFQLAINHMGKRVCEGNACKDLGFSNYGTGICTCGIGDGRSCYYMD